MELFDLDSPQDLLCRGFNRAEILEKTGFDVGHNGNTINPSMGVIDRRAYRVQFVVTYVDKAVFLDLLNKYGDKILSKGEVLAVCGLSVKARVGLRNISEAFGLHDEFREVHLRECNGRNAVREATNMARHGYKSPFSDPAKRKEIGDTLERLYGARVPSQSPLIKDRIKCTNLERYGHECVLSVKAIRDRGKVTSLRKYGTEVPMRCKSVQDRYCATMTVRHGAPYTRQCPELVAKCDATTFKHFGVTNSMKSEVVRARAIATNLRVRGVPYALMDKSVRDKGNKTQIAKYGCLYVQTDEFKNRFREQQFTQYGMWYIQTDEFKGKFKSAMMAAYGVEWPMQNEGIKAKNRATLFAHRGVEYVMQDPEYLANMLATKESNGTLGGSGAEDALYAKLVAKFGIDDVVRQYRVEPYLFLCDFYIKSRDLRIELNGYVSHGCHWYGSSFEDELRVFESHVNNTSVIPHGDDVWICRDVEKRRCAEENRLNYVVFWGDVGQDADIWFSLNCPDGRDWLLEYSWLPDRALTCDIDAPAILVDCDDVIWSAIQSFCWNTVHAAALDFWSVRFDNRWGTRQARIYAACIARSGKSFGELASSDVLSTMYETGLVVRHGPFNGSCFRAFFGKYSPKTLYIPCIGFGEPLLVAALADISVVGLSADESFADGFFGLMDKYNTNNVSLLVGSPARMNLSKFSHDAVFAWVSRDMISGMNADELDMWWHGVVQNSVSDDTSVFVYQADKHLIKLFSQILMDAGWRLLRHLAVHTPETKVYSECFQIFIRDV